MTSIGAPVCSLKTFWTESAPLPKNHSDFCHFKTLNSCSVHTLSEYSPCHLFFLRGYLNHANKTSATASSPFFVASISTIFQIAYVCDGYFVVLSVRARPSSTQTNWVMSAYRVPCPMKENVVICSKVGSISFSRIKPHVL